MTGPVQDLFAFALNLYRAPLNYRSFIGSERPVPDNFQELLETLNKRTDHEAWDELVEALSTSAEELREAGFFLVRRVLFIDGADHYRVLGLDSSSSIAAIRERYRLLIGLFHPDKNSQGDEWGELYALKINDAYNVLKNPDKKFRYDQQLSPLSSAAADNRPRHRASGAFNGSWGPGKTPTPARDTSSSDDFHYWHDPSVSDNPFGAGFDIDADQQTIVPQAPDVPPSRATETVLPQRARSTMVRNVLWGLVFLGGLLAGIVIGKRGGVMPQPGPRAIAPTAAPGSQPSSTNPQALQIDDPKQASQVAMAQGMEPMPESESAQSTAGMDRLAADAQDNYAFAVSAADKLLTRVLPTAGGRTEDSKPADCGGPNCAADAAAVPSDGPGDDKASSHGPLAKTTPREPKAPPPRPEHKAASRTIGVSTASTNEQGSGPGEPVQIAGEGRESVKSEPAEFSGGKSVRHVPPVIPKSDTGMGEVVRQPSNERGGADPLPAETKRDASAVPTPPAALAYTAARRGSDEPGKALAAKPQRSPRADPAASALRVPVRQAVTVHDGGHGQSAIAGAASRPAPIAPVVRKLDVDRLLARFIQAYEKGDVGKFAALFSKQAVTNDGIGRGAIYTSYGDFFASSEERSMQISDLIWSNDRGGKATLSFVVHISVVQGVFSTAKHYDGDVNMRVFLDGRQLLISEFLHRVEKL